MGIKSKIGISIALTAGFLLTKPGFDLTWAQDVNNRTVEQYTCKDVMREHGDNRDVTISFLHGYVLGKSGQSAFNIENLHKQTSAFIEHCLDNPGERAADAMSKIKG